MHYHAANPPYFIFQAFVFALVIGIVKNHKATSLLILLFILNVVISVIHALYNWSLFSDLIKPIPFINSFQWDRFYLLSPLIWYFHLALSVKIVFDAVRHVRWGTSLLIFIFFCQFYFLWKDNKEYQETVYNLFSGKHYGTSFKDFYSRELFSEIRDYLGKPQSKYTVGSIALHPSVAQYNGFYTIDSYQNNYLLSYKKHFRNIISGELNKSANLTKYFDEWGSRCYLFVNGVFPTYSVTRWAGYSSVDAIFDFENGPPVDYIFSAIEITNPETSNLKLLKLFDNESSIYKIYLYKVSAGRRQKAIDEIRSLPINEGIVGISSDIGFDQVLLDSLPAPHEVLPRKQLIAEAGRFGFLVIDAQGNDIRIIKEPGELVPEELNVDLLTNYWDYNNEVLVVAATTTLSSPPIKFVPGAYELSITGESTSVQHITSHLGIEYLFPISVSRTRQKK
jgi:hypothetical protein